jgi:LacI family transcriptional regulator
MTVRMKDIARDLGISVVTVSKVLNNHADIGEETRQRVLRRIRELNYRPNLAAQALATGRTSTIGLIVPDPSHPFFGDVAQALLRALRKMSYSLLISSSEEDPELERQEMEELLARKVDALVVASVQRNVESFRRIEENRTPYVLLDRQFTGLAANFVGVSDEAAGELATRHLMDAGCRRIAHIRGPRASGYEAMRKVLATDPRPDGVFCSSDPVAVGAMKAVLDAGLRIPEDVALIGCGNAHYADLLRVPLSSVDRNSVATGERAAQLALSLVRARDRVEPQSILLEPRLVVRASSARSGLRTASAPHSPGE